MKVRLVTLAMAWVVLLGACTPTTGEPVETGPQGQLRVRLAGETLVTIAVQNVFDHSQVYLLDCTEQQHLLDGGSFCDELLVLPPGIYEIIAQSQDPNCSSERAHYKVIVEEGQTVEVPITVICEADGGVQEEVPGPDRPSITARFLNFIPSGAPATSEFCRCGENVRVTVQVEDPDTACSGLTPTWSVVDAFGTNVTATLLSNAQAIPGDPCVFTADLDAAVALGSYNVTFAVTDGAPPTIAMTFPVSLVDCGAGTGSCG